MDNYSKLRPDKCPIFSLPPFLISWMKQVPIRKWGICQKSQIQCYSVSLQPSPKSLGSETEDRDLISTVVGKNLWGSAYKSSKQLGYSWRAWSSCYTPVKHSPSILIWKLLPSVFLSDSGQTISGTYRPCISRLTSIATEREEGICPETIRMKFSVA